MNSGALLAVLLALTAADEPARIVYSKSFPGSNPAYVNIVLDEQGHGEYREDPDDDSPLRFQLGQAETREIFALAEKLDRFGRPLEANLKVAFTGHKIFRYERGSLRQEVKFNYSTDPDARALLDWFERITETERIWLNLERTAKYDRLGVNQVLLELEVAYDRKRLVAPQQFLNLLERIASNMAFLNIARDRAARLAEAFAAAQAKP